MSWLNIFRSPKKNPTRPCSAALAKERLQVIVAHERVKRTGPDFLPKLQKEITDVISKYVQIRPEDVHVDFAQSNERSVLELNITFPDDEKEDSSVNSSSAQA